MKYSEKVTNKLNELLEKTYDAERGYKLAVDKVEEPTIKKFLNDRVQQRYNFGHQLKKEIAEFGKLPEKGGSFKGDLHRVWMNLTASLSPNETERILNEVERGERASLNDYNDILNNSDFQLPMSTENMLKEQRDAIEESIRATQRFEAVVS